MREPGQVVSAAFPRPGRTLKGVLAVVALFAIASAVAGWVPRLVPAFDWLVFRPADALTRPWTFVTSGVITLGLWQALWSLLGLYFFTTDLEKRWGGARLVRFLIASVVLANLIVLGVDKLPFLPRSFHPEFVAGPWAAITAIAVAWARENRHGQMFFFFFPLPARIFFLITVAIAVLVVVFQQPLPEGVVAPLAGCLAGVALGGTPSPMRTAWLKLRLAVMRRRGQSVTAELSRPPSSEKPRSSKRSGKSPPLRVVYGGLEEDLKSRKPPKDKRFLN
ncbi:MAG TPA: rhomboid family intramembrane serine protease [Labilithrix sp.]